MDVLKVMAMFFSAVVCSQIKDRHRLKKNAKEFKLLSYEENSVSALLQCGGQTCGIPKTIVCYSFGGFNGV